VHHRDVPPLAILELQDGLHISVGSCFSFKISYCVFFIINKCLLLFEKNIFVLVMIGGERGISISDDELIEFDLNLKGVLHCALVWGKDKSENI
jgi:hypothetical protein